MVAGFYEIQRILKALIEELALLFWIIKLLKKVILFQNFMRSCHM